MMVFWIVVVLLIIAALLFVIPPLFQRGESDSELVKREELSIAVFQDQVEELERDLRNGTLSQEQFDLAKQDIERELLESTKSGEELSSHSGDIAAMMASKASAWVIIIALPILTISFYNVFGGGPEAFDPASVQPQVAADGHQGNDVQQMIAALQQRLEENPEDAEGWAMLGRSYYFIQDYGTSARAYERAIELYPQESADLYADYADAKALANNRSLQGKPMEAVERAVQIDPSHVKALWLAGTGAYQAQDWQKAKQYWERLVSLLEPGSDNAQMINANLSEIYQRLGETAPQQQSVPAASTGATVNGTVELAPELVDRVSPNDVVFIYAKAAEGPRMPLAILRKQVSDLPMAFTLDDSTAMTPQAKISNFEKLIIGARVSKSGTAVAQSGDYEGLSGVINLSDGDEIHLIISDMVE